VAEEFKPHFHHDLRKSANKFSSEEESMIQMNATASKEMIMSTYTPIRGTCRLFRPKRLNLIAIFRIHSKGDSLSFASLLTP
jgi:hypothetical protein